VSKHSPGVKTRNETSVTKGGNTTESKTRSFNSTKPGMFRYTRNNGDSNGRLIYCMTILVGAAVWNNVTWHCTSSILRYCPKTEERNRGND
jgi:hypothetical protein